MLSGDLVAMINKHIRLVSFLMFRETNHHASNLMLEIQWANDCKGYTAPYRGYHYVHNKVVPPQLTIRYIPHHPSSCCYQFIQRTGAPPACLDLGACEVFHGPHVRGFKVWFVFHPQPVTLSMWV